MASLTIDKLAKSFGRTRVLNDISFTVADGEFCVLLGPSGCGKSTLLRIVAGLEHATEGSIAIDGAPVAHLAPRERDIAFVFQNYALYPHMTVFDNLAFSLRLRGLPKDEIHSRVTAAARLLEIENQLPHKPQQLSGGQRQRVALGRAIVRRPKIFLFDEPLSNLDATLRSTMRVELAQLHQRLGATMLYVTHDQAEAMTLGDQIVVLHEGKIEQRGAPRDIYRQPANTFIAGFVGSPRMNLLDGEVTDDGKCFRCGALDLDLSQIVPVLPALPPSTPLTLGLRPEHIHSAAPGTLRFRGIVKFVEDLGADRLIHLDCSGVGVTVRASGKDSCKKSERRDFGVDAGDLYWFSAGTRLGGTPAK